jgi:predicted TIM-barrel fold metal-dependent hydrolase
MLFAQLYSSPKARLATAEDLITSMDAQGIDISVVLNINWSSLELCRETNDYILESISRYPRRLIGFGMVALDSVETAIEEIERCRKHGIKGIGEIRPTLGWLRNSTIEPLIQSIIEKGLVLLTHVSEPVGHVYPGKGDITPEALYPFISKFPGLKLVCAHWGGGLPFYALMPEVKKTLENVYFDSAASPFLYHPQVYGQVAQLAGPEKVLFGSDYPLIPPKRLLTEIEQLKFPPKFKSQLLGENAARLLGLINRG